MYSQVCVGVEVAVAGCSTVCQLYWAQGVPLSCLPLPAIAHILEQASAACAASGLSFAPSQCTRWRHTPSAGAAATLRAVSRQPFAGRASHDVPAALDLRRAAGA